MLASEGNLLSSMASRELCIILKELLKNKKIQWMNLEDILVSEISRLKEIHAV